MFQFPISQAQQLMLEAQDMNQNANNIGDRENFGSTNNQVSCTFFIRITNTVFHAKPIYYFNYYYKYKLLIQNESRKTMCRIRETKERKTQFRCVLLKFLELQFLTCNTWCLFSTRMLYMFDKKLNGSYQFIPSNQLISQSKIRIPISQKRKLNLI